MEKGKPVSDELDIPTPTYRVPRRSRGMDPGTRRLALIAGGLGGALVLLVGGWSLLGNRSTTVPVVQADSSPMRVKPADPGGLHVAGANDDIMDNNPDAAADKLAPASETPAPQDMKPAAVASAPPAAAVTAGTASSAAAPIAAAPLTAKPLVAARTGPGGRRRAPGASGIRQNHPGPACRPVVRGCGADRVAAAGEADAEPAGQPAAGRDAVRA